MDLELCLKLAQEKGRQYNLKVWVPVVFDQINMK